MATLNPYYIVLNFLNYASSKEFSPIINNRIRISNFSILIVILLTFSFVPLYIAIGNFVGAAFCTISVLIHFFTRTTLKNGNFLKARLYLVINLALTITLNDINMGPFSGNHLFHFGLIVALFLLFDLTNWKYLLLSLLSVFISYGLLFIEPAIFPAQFPLDKEIINIYYSIAFTIDLLAVVSFMILYNYQYSELVRNLLELNTSYEKSIKLNTEYDLQTKRRREEFRKNKDDFIKLTTDELKDPIIGISALSKELFEDSQEISRDEIQEISLALSISANKLENKLEDFFEWSKILTGEGYFNKEYHELSYIVNPLISYKKQTLDQSKVNISLKDSTDGRVYSDLAFLKYSLSKLIDVSLSKGRVLGDIKITHTRNDNFDLLEYNDTNFPHHFELIKSALKNEESAKGLLDQQLFLSLSIIGKLTRLHDGIIEIVSKGKKNVSFKIHFERI